MDGRIDGLSDRDGRTWSLLEMHGRIVRFVTEKCVPPLVPLVFP